ncbi:MAG: zf-HC2 domain-containing protein [Clostridiaceae bacterium]|jgi:hypothetical protein|nr:zf-HC2 domain-containing protein [Clostridiaceae bacterium]
MHVREKDISLYLDNSLVLKERKKLESHFLVCSACRQKLQEYKNLNQAMNSLDIDFPLDGLESKVVNRIKEQRISLTVKPVDKKSFSPGYIYALILFVIAGLFYTPAGDVAEQVAQNATTFMLNRWLDWINKVKWQVIDMYASVISAGFTVFFLPLFSGIFLIAGGAYLFINKSAVKKV